MRRPYAPWLRQPLITLWIILAVTVSSADGACVNNPCTILTPDQVAAVAYGAGFRGGSLVYAIAVAKAESDFALDALNDQNLDDSDDFGLWQINSVHGFSSQQLLQDASYNARAAFQVSAGGTNWCPWVVYWQNRFRVWLTDPARPHAQAIDSTVIRPIAQESSRVRTISEVNVRATAGGDFVRRLPAGTTGTVLAGPLTQDLDTCGPGRPRYHDWWRIHWDDGGPTGWSAEDDLERIGSGASIALSLNKTTFIPGDTLLLTLQASNDGPAVTSDFYLGDLGPDGTVSLYTSLSPLKIVKTTLSDLAKVAKPLGPKIPIAQFSSVIHRNIPILTFPADFPSGQTTLFAALTTPDHLDIIAPVATVDFTFAPL